MDLEHYIDNTESLKRSLKYVVLESPRDLKNLQIVFEKINKNILKEIFLVERDGNRVKISCRKTYVVDYLVSKFKEPVVLVKGVGSTLEDIGYAKDLTSESYHVIPASVWSSAWFTRYTHYAFKKLKKEKIVVQEHHCTDPSKKVTSKEVEDFLLQRKWIQKPTDGATGTFVYSESYIDFVEKLKRRYKEIVLKDITYKKTRFLPLLSLNDFIKTKYLHTVIDNLFFAQTTSAISTSLKPKSYLENYLSPKELKDHCGDVFYGFNYCSCQGLYPVLRNLNTKENLFYLDDAYVTTYRREHGKCSSLKRLEAFNRFEIVGICSEKTCEEPLKKIHQNIIEFFKQLNFEFKVEKVGSWILDDYSMSTLEAKNIPYTLDFQAYFENTCLEAANLSNNQTHWTAPYNIKWKGQNAVSICSGMGQQRLVWLTLLFNGLDSKKWPQWLKD